MTQTLPIVRINPKIVRKIQAAIEREGCIDQDNIRYFPEKFNFKSKSFDLFFSKFEDSVPDFETDDQFNFSDVFADLRISFIVVNMDFKFTWRLIVGQGSILQAWSAKSKKIPFDEKNAVRVNVRI